MAAPLAFARKNGEYPAFEYKHDQHFHAIMQQNSCNWVLCPSFGSIFLGAHPTGLSVPVILTIIIVELQEANTLLWIQAPIPET
jgi:hypothetical protein